MVRGLQSIILCAVILFFCGISVTAQTTKKVDSLEQKLKQAVVDTSRLNLMRKLSVAYSTVNPEKKLYYARHYKVLAEKLKIDSIVVDAYLDMGVYYGIRSKMDSALYYFSLGYDKAKSSNYQTGMGRGLVNIGFSYDRLNNKQEAVKSYMTALRIFKKIKLKRGINQCYINIGSIYYDLGEYKLSLYYFSEALKSFTEDKDQSGIAKAMNALGNVNKSLGQFDKARDCFTKSLDIRIKIEDLNGIALSRMGLGSLDSKEKRYDSALKNLQIALEYNHKIKDPYQENAILIEIAKAYLGNKNYKQAEFYGKLALAGSKAIESKVAMSNSYSILIDIYKLKKDIPKAFFYQTAYISNEDSIAVEKTVKDVMLTEFKRIRSENDGLVKDNYKIARKNTDYLKTILITSVLLFLVFILMVTLYRRNKEKLATNKILQKQKEEIAIINGELEVLNKELNRQMTLTAGQNIELEKLNTVKNKFFSIVSHDLRSPLANLQMLFRLYREGELDEKDLSEVLGRLEETIYSTSTFLDNLLEWSKSQLEGMNIKPSLFSPGNLISENLKLIDSQINLKGLKVENCSDENVMAYADENMINLIIRNLLGNSVKFCNPGDIITIDVKQNADKVLLSVADTGPGIEESDLEKLFNLEYTVSKGTYGEKGHHLGLILCKDMVQQNNGKIWVVSELGSGTVFWVELPINKSLSSINF